MPGGFIKGKKATTDKKTNISCSQMIVASSSIVLEEVIGYCNVSNISLSARAVECWFATTLLHHAPLKEASVVLLFVIFGG